MTPLVGHLEVAEKRANMESVDVRMRRQKWRWIGHILRKDEKYIARKTMEWNPLIRAERLPGRPRETWRRTVARSRSSSVKFEMI